MTKDEIMELARQAGFVYAGESFQDLNKPIEAFAKLIEERTLKQLNTEETV